MMNLIIFAVTIAVVFFLSHKRPEYIAIFALIFSSTLPSIIGGEIFAIGTRGNAIRMQYLVLAIGLFFIINPLIKKYPVTKNRLGYLMGIMFLIMLLSVPIALYWKYKISISVSVLLLETYLYFFIVLRLTQRKHIPRLINIVIFIGIIIALLLSVLSITESGFLYNMINPPEYYDIQNLSRIQGITSGQTMSWLRYNVRVIPILAIISFVLFLLQKKNKNKYLIFTAIFVFYAIISGQRALVLSIIIGLVFSLFFLNRYKYINYKKLPLFISFLIVISLVIFIFMQTGLIEDRLTVSAYRAQFTEVEIIDQRFIIGPILAYNEIAKAGINAWLFGFSGYTNFELGGGNDINTPILMIYKYGLVGLTAILVLLWTVLKKSLGLLKSRKMTNYEVSLVLGIILFILLGFSISIIREFYFANDFSALSWFIIMVAWMEVISRDSIAKRIR